MKLAIVGAGSTYTPELVLGICAHGASLGLAELALFDVVSTRLEVIAAFCRRAAEARGLAAPLRVVPTLAEALDGADFVVVQIRVGGQEGRHADIRLGLDHGVIGQETTGVGGFAKALRSIPAVLEIARAMQVHCPGAWLLNFTNPSGMVTEAVLGHAYDRCVGLCNVPIELQMDLARRLGVDASRVSLDWVGLNHLGWVRGVHVDGTDRLPELLGTVGGESQMANLPDLVYPPGFIEALGMIPTSYTRLFYASDEVLAQLLAAKRSRAERVMELEAEVMAAYADPTSTELPPQLSKRGGAWYSRLAVEVVRALSSGAPTVHIVNVANGTTMPFLAPDAVVEVACELSSAGVRPLPIRPAEDAISGLIHQVKSYERLGDSGCGHTRPRLGLSCAAGQPAGAGRETRAGVARRARGAGAAGLIWRARVGEPCADRGGRFFRATAVVCVKSLGLSCSSRSGHARKCLRTCPPSLAALGTTGSSSALLGLQRECALEQRTDHRRPVPRHQHPRKGRHGRGLSRGAPDARHADRAQGHQPRPARGPELPGPVRG